ncbi:MULTISPECIES: hypothetical protein [Bacteria]|uniref:Lipoprotein n=1 Tax=Lysobacter enzymogenes TaxID=69 RepID=A0AAU9AGH3_LYSEN|nr:hypothetical protein [Lysobacter enzymogenes]BAV96003.1 hypothetical protein LEN_0516 [Lysobacter enzymogenes]
MAARSDSERAWQTAMKPSVRSQSATLSFAATAALTLLSGCASNVRSTANDPLTIERVLTEPLSGVAGMGRVSAELSKIYGINPSGAKYINRDAKTLADGQVLSLFWLEPPPADFISLGLAAEPCFSTQRALNLTQATPYEGSGKVSAPIYNAFKNGMLVGITSTPDGKCLQTIHIERDK